MKRTKSLILIALALAGSVFVSPRMLADETNAAAGGQNTEELAKEAQNPVAKLISVPFQNNFNFNVGPNNVTQYILNVQPVIPISLNDNWNLITRIIMPIINQPSPAPGVPNASGLGDINPTFFLSPANASKKFIWGVGPTFTLPTATDSLLGNSEWCAGPAAVALTMQGHWVVGALVNQQWSFAGWGDHYVSAFLAQPFVNYNLPHGWYLSSSPVMTANWAADSHDQWTVPLGGGIGKIQWFGKLPINFQLQAFGNVVKPSYGPDWQLRFQIQFMFPK
ncbi:MAG: neuromedin U [Verrucomicrobiota bacterium]|jgi:hypothetical protein